MRVFRNIAAALLSIAVMAGASAAPVGATGCKVITNPGEAFFQEWQSPWTTIYPMGFSGSLITGDSTSGCNDLNMANIPAGSPVCNTFGGKIFVIPQYWANGGWVTDNGGGAMVPCGTSTLTVIGRGYANNATFRILIDVGDNFNGGQFYAWPSFKLYV